MTAMQSLDALQEANRVRIDKSHIRWWLTLGRDDDYQPFTLMDALKHPSARGWHVGDLLLYLPRQRHACARREPSSAHSPNVTEAARRRSMDLCILAGCTTWRRAGDLTARQRRVLVDAVEGGRW